MVPSLPPVAGGLISPKQFWRAVAGCETGPIAVHPDKPHIVYGNCKGRFSRFNHVTGQEMQYWVYPHFNYGQDAHQRLVDIEKILAEHTTQLQMVMDKNVKRLNAKLREMGQAEVVLGEE